MTTPKPRRRDEYPFAIQQAGHVAFRVFDQVEQGLLDDGFTQEEGDDLMMINIDQILTEAQQIAKQEAAADKRRKESSGGSGGGKQRSKQGGTD